MAKQTASKKHFDKLSVTLFKTIDFDTKKPPIEVKGGFSFIP